MDVSTKLRDLGLAAALVSCGFEVVIIERATGGQAYFYFVDTDGLRGAISSYWADTLDVRARTYSDNIKMLKTRIYGGQ